MKPSQDDIIPLAAGESPPLPGAVKVRGPILPARAGRLSARSKARKAALDVLYEAELRSREPVEVMRDQLAAGELVRDFTQQIIVGIKEHHVDIDQRIAESASSDWTLERMPAIDRNLARIAMWELDYTQVGIDAAISEAVLLANQLSTDSSVAFLNGLLARAAQTRPQADGPVESTAMAPSVLPGEAETVNPEVVNPERSSDEQA